MAEQKKWRSASHADRSTRLRAYVAKVIIRQNDVEIQPTDGAHQLSTGAHSSTVQDEAEWAIKVPVTMKLAASGKAIVSLDGSARQESRVDKALPRAVARANRWRELLESGVAWSAYDLARLESCRVSYVQRHLPLAFLAPDIVEAIVAGRQPRSWMLSDMITDTACLSWTGYRPK